MADYAGRWRSRRTADARLEHVTTTVAAVSTQRHKRRRGVRETCGLRPSALPNSGVAPDAACSWPGAYAPPLSRARRRHAGCSSLIPSKLSLAATGARLRTVARGAGRAGEREVRWAAMAEDVVEVATFSFLHQAELAASALRAAGVTCTIPDSLGRGRVPGNIFTGATYRIFVREADLDRARQILQQ